MPWKWWQHKQLNGNPATKGKWYCKVKNVSAKISSNTKKYMWTYSNRCGIAWLLIVRDERTISPHQTQERQYICNDKDLIFHISDHKVNSMLLFYRFSSVTMCTVSISISNIWYSVQVDSEIDTVDALPKYVLNILFLSFNDTVV